MNKGLPMKRRTTGKLVAGIALLTIVVVQALLIAPNPGNPWVQEFDDSMHRAIGVGPDSAVYTGFIPMFFQHLGQLPGMVALFLVLPIVLIIVGRWRTALFVLAAQLAGPGLVSQTLKNTVNRPRPAANEAEGLFGPLFMVDHGSFPSGHATSAGLLAIIVIALIPTAHRGWRIAAGVVGALIAVGMIWQRTLINAHWMSDAVVGSMAGIGVGLILWWAFEPWLRRDYARTPWFRRSETATSAHTSAPSPMATAADA